MMIYPLSYKISIKKFICITLTYMHVYYYQSKKYCSVIILSLYIDQSYMYIWAYFLLTTSIKYGRYYTDGSAEKEDLKKYSHWFVIHVQSIFSEEPLPVIFFIHGGIFLIGASDMYPGQELALNGQVIVVTFNYRVGTIGFLSTGDSNAPGNQGLWDDAAALGIFSIYLTFNLN